MSLLFPKFTSLKAPSLKVSSMKLPRISTPKTPSISVKQPKISSTKAPSVKSFSNLSKVPKLPASAKMGSLKSALGKIKNGGF